MKPLSVPIVDALDLLDSLDLLDALDRLSFPAVVGDGTVYKSSHVVQ